MDSAESSNITGLMQQPFLWMHPSLSSFGCTQVSLSCLCMSLLGRVWLPPFTASAEMVQTRHLGSNLFKQNFWELIIFQAIAPLSHEAETRQQIENLWWGLTGTSLFQVYYNKNRKYRMRLIFWYPPWIRTSAVTKLLCIWEFEDASVFYLFGWFIKSFDVP